MLKVSILLNVNEFCPVVFISASGRKPLKFQTLIYQCLLTWEISIGSGNEQYEEENYCKLLVPDIGIGAGKGIVGSNLLMIDDMDSHSLAHRFSLTPSKSSKKFVVMSSIYPAPACIYQCNSIGYKQLKFAGNMIMSLCFSIFIRNRGL